MDIYEIKKAVDVVFKFRSNYIENNCHIVIFNFCDIFQNISISKNTQKRKLNTYRYFAIVASILTYLEKKFITNLLSVSYKIYIEIGFPKKKIINIYHDFHYEEILFFFIRFFKL